MYIGDFGQPVDNTAADRAREAQDRVDRIIGRESELSEYNLEQVRELYRGAI